MTLFTIRDENSDTRVSTKNRRSLQKNEKSETQKAYTRLSFNSTSPKYNVEWPQRVYLEALAILRDARGEDFEFGMENQFSRRLLRLSQLSGVIAIEAIASIILQNRADARVVGEVLRWLGDIDHRESYFLRLRLLETCLRHESRWVRDGALLGLDAMNNQHALPYLIEAMQAETVSELRKDIQEVIERLSNTL